MLCQYSISGSYDLRSVGKGEFSLGNLMVGCLIVQIVKIYLKYKMLFYKLFCLIR